VSVYDVYLDVGADSPYDVVLWPEGVHDSTGPLVFVRSGVFSGGEDLFGAAAVIAAIAGEASGGDEASGGGSIEAGAGGQVSSGDELAAASSLEYRASGSVTGGDDLTGGAGVDVHRGGAVEDGDQLSGGAAVVYSSLATVIEGAELSGSATTESTVVPLWEVGGTVVEGGTFGGGLALTLPFLPDGPSDTQLERTLFVARRPRAVWAARTGQSTMRLASTGRSRIAPVVALTSFKLTAHGKTGFRR
jgi:hypothetical protein